MDEIPVLNSDGPVQSVQIDVMPHIDKPKEPKTAKIPKDLIFCYIISYDQGDEDRLQDAMMEFFLTTPQIIYSTTWVVGITTYFMFIYR